MATTPFSDIKRPICDEFVEIGQATFTELISVRQKTTKPAIGNATPSVSVALKELAFGRSCRGETQDPSTPGSFAVIPPTPPAGSSAASASVAASKYSINGGGQAYQKTVAELEMAKSTAEFNSLIANAGLSSFGASDCKSITGNAGVPDIDTRDCSEVTCGIDAVFSVGHNTSLTSGSNAHKVNEGVQGIAQLIAKATGGALDANGNTIDPQGNYRFGYSNFGQSETINDGRLIARTSGTGRTLRLTPQYCGNSNPSRQYDGVNQAPFSRIGSGASTGADQRQGWHEALESVAFNIHDAERLGTGAISFANTQNWTFRKDSSNLSRVLILFVNISGKFLGSEPGVWPDEAKALAAASEMGRCGIKLAIVWLGRRAQFSNRSGSQFANDAEFFDELVDRAGGIWLNAPVNGAAIISQMTSFIDSLCESSPPPAECDGGEDLILNGSFDLNLSGWTLDESIGPVVWDETFESSAPGDPIGKGSAKFSPGGIITQRVVGTPGSFLDIKFNWCYEDDVLGSRTIQATPRDSSGAKITVLSGIHVITNDTPCSENRNTRDPIRVVIPEDGIVDVLIRSEFSDTGSALYIDNVIACAISNDECGPGRTNHITNPNFEDGVTGWTDAAGVALPATDPTVWDSSILTIIIDVAEENEVRQQITDLDPGTNVSLNFELTSWEPASTGSLEFIFGVVETGDSTTLTRNTTTVPERHQIEFVVPNDGIATIFFRGGNPSGIAKVRNVLVCSASTGECETGFAKISFDGFDTNRGGWSGGAYDSVNELMFLDAETPPGDPGRSINQSFPGLPIGATFQITFSNLLPPPPSDGSVPAAELELHLISGTVDDPFMIPAVAGTYTFQSTVQSTGLMTVTLEAINPSGFIDDILCCINDTSGDCDGSITDVQALIEWQGTPRQPVNFFNAIVRYTIRNPLDPLDITEFTFVADSEGRLGIFTCDLWKSEIGPDTTILQRGLNPALISTITAGDFDSIAAKNNWLWSIPQGDAPATQDNLIINFPAPPGLVENVKFLFLINNTTPEAGTGTIPVNPSPHVCTPDPAIEFDISIRFINSNGLQREFRVPVLESTIWEEEEDFGQNLLPWDTESATGNGIKGSTARWEEADFLLDSVDGRGLDQCTEPTFFAADGEGDLVFKKFELSGNGISFDPCDAEIIIEDISDGGSANEIQSIILPTPSGGTWTLAFTFGGSTQTAILPWNTTAEQLRVRLSALSNITSIKNVNVTGSGTLADPFLVEFTNDLGAIDHELMVANGSNLTGASSAFITTENDGTNNERQRITNPTDGRQDLVITFAGNDSVAIPYGSSLNVVQSALEGIIGIGAGNISVTGDVTDRDAFYIGPYVVDFIGALANANVTTMIAAPDHYAVSTDWHGGPSGGQNEKQLINVQATGGTFTLRVYNLGSPAAPSVVITTSNDGGISGKDCYDVEFGGTLTGDNIDVNSFFGPSASFVHTQQNIRQGESGTLTSPVTEVQRHCFEWISKLSGFADDDSQFGLTDPSDTIFNDIIDTVAGDLLVLGIDSRTAIKTYLESAAGVATDDLTLTVNSLATKENEIQVITIKNNPTGGTFTISLEGETTDPIPFNATALQMRDTLRALALPGMSDIAVGQSGTFPGDVTYAISFVGEADGKNWDQMTADDGNLESDADFADTAPIAYNATPAAVESALVTAANFLTAADIDITQVISDEPNGLFIWRAEFTGAFAKQDVRQMEANGANLTGAPILVEEFQKGGGTNDRQRLTIVNATGGSFRLTVTIDGINYKTTAIPWNTTAAGLQIQLLALAPFTAEDLTVTEIPKTASNQQLRVIITFKKKFGNVPLIIADFQSTLLCNPIILPYVDPGPYDYPLPDCDDLDDDLSCQSGPLLCRPGEGDEPIVLEPCCDADTIPLAVNCSTRLDFQRDLFDPNTVSTPGCTGVGGVVLTIRDLAVLKGLNPSNFVPYFRNFNTQVFTSASYSTKIDTKMSVILIENELDTKRGRHRITEHLKNHREVLPARFVWPDCDVTNPVIAPEACWPGIGSN